MGLTGLGMVPGIGEFANAASGAALSAVALVPIAGEAADAAKEARLAGRVAREGEDLTYATQSGGKFSQAATESERGAVGGGSAARRAKTAQDALKPAPAPASAEKPLTNVFGGGTPTAVEVENWAQGNGWTRSQTSTGPVKYTDRNGVVRVTVKQGSARTAGSETPHVELRDHTGQRVDPAGSAVSKRSAGNHTPIK